MFANFYSKYKLVSLCWKQNDTSSSRLRKIELSIWDIKAAHKVGFWKKKNKNKKNKKTPKKQKQKTKQKEKTNKNNKTETWRCYDFEKRNKVLFRLKVIVKKKKKKKKKREKKRNIQDKSRPSNKICRFEIH